MSLVCINSCRLCDGCMACQDDYEAEDEDVADLWQRPGFDTKERPTIRGRRVNQISNLRLSHF